MITGLLLFYAIIGLILVGGAILTHIVLTTRHEQRSREQKGHSN